MAEFAYLHVHTHYSRGGGPAAPAEWCSRALELGYGALGTADRGPLAGLPAFSKAAAHSGLMPIYGAELEVILPAPKGRKSPHTGHGQRVALFASSREGLANLFQLCSLAYAGWPGKETAVSWEALADRRAGLILVLLGGDEAGALSSFALAPASKRAGLGSIIKASFADSAFVGIPHSGSPGDGALAAQVVKAAGEMGLPILAMPTARYLRPSDAPSYEALRIARARAGWPRSDPADALSTSTTATSLERPGPHYLRSPEEALALFKEWPEAVENVSRVVELCPDMGHWRSPFAGAPSGSPLSALAERRLLARLRIDDLPIELRERLSSEVASVEKQGMQGAWLALASVAAEARKAGIPLGAPLGQADGSLLAFALGVASPLPTLPAASPLAQGQAGRPLPPPGVQIPGSRREALLSALVSEHGSECIAQHACPLDIAPLQAVQASASVLGMGGAPLVRLAVEVVDKGWAAFDAAPETSTALSRLACALRGSPLYFMPDPQGMVVAPRTVYGDVGLTANAPLIGYDQGVIRRWIPWTAERLNELGYPLLAVSESGPLSALELALSMARKYPSPGFEVGRLDFSVGPPTTEGMKQILAKARLVAVPYLSTALLKGWKGEAGIEGIMAVAARSVAGARKLPPPPDNPIWAQATAGTDGALLYKDQFEAIVAGACGLDALQARDVRLALVEGRAEEARARFAEGCLANGQDEAATQELWSALCGSVGTLVSRHTAFARARLALWCIAVKAGHPAAWLVSALWQAWERRGRAGIAPLVEEARRLGVSILPPHADLSIALPAPEREGAAWAVRWGLAWLPGWDEAVAARFIAARPAHGFATLEVLGCAVGKAKLSPMQIESLIRSGALDILGGGPAARHSLLAIAPALLEWATNAAESTGQLDLFSADKARARATLPSLPDSPDKLTPRQLHSLRAWEEQHLGIGFTPAAEIEALRRALSDAGGLQPRLVSTARILDMTEGRSVYLLGLLTAPRLLEAAQGGLSDPLAVARVEDLEGAIELIAFPPNYKRHRNIWVENNLVIITARVGKHQDGETYLLCEHLAAYNPGGGQEGTFAVKVKPSRKARPQAASPSAIPEHEPEGVIKSVAISSGYQTAASTKATLQQAASAAYKLVITMPASPDDHADIDKMIALKRLLETHPGPDIVSLRIPYSLDTGATTSARLSVGVEYNAVLAQEIADLLGPQALAVIKL